MAVPEDQRPMAWRDVDPPTLTRLLESGLTPDEIGVLYERSASSVRAAAARWGLDCRALRARAVGLAVTHPTVAAQFVHVVDGAPLGYGPHDLLTGSAARCQWRCPVCATEWVTSVANRTRRQSGCPDCARRRGRDIARARPVKSSPLARTAPELATDFVSNLSRPDRDFSTTPSGSHDRILWRCLRGHEWRTTARQRVRHGTQCPTCLMGLWTSRLEYEVAELVHLATGLTVTVGARLPRADRAVDERVDLRVEEMGLLVDLDPSRWHRLPDAIERDTRKLKRLTSKSYVRIRPRRLGLLATGEGDSTQQVLLSSDDEKDPWQWSLGILQALSVVHRELEIRQPDMRERAAARARADSRWRRLRSAPRRRSLQTEHPSLAAEFVEVVDREGITPVDLAPSGDDRVLWRCRLCGHEWEARVANRTVLGTGCPPCSYRRGGALAARPRPADSFADRHPGLVEQFLENETNPGKTLSDLKPNSIDSCRWTCPYCARPWIATPHARHQRPSAGCRACSYERASRTRSRRTR